MRVNSAWSQQSKLIGSDAVGTANQGYSVAISADGNTAAVGGVNDDNSAGAVFVFTRTGSTWTQQGSKLVGTGAVGTYSQQGDAVSISADGNTLLSGGYYDDGGIGAAWVFTRSGGVWTQQGGKLIGTDAVGLALQGKSVALSGDGDTAMIGGASDNNNVGAAWVFKRSGGVWTQQGNKLIGTGAVGAAQQASSVALSMDGNTASIGGPGDNGVGAVWTFARSGGVWTQQGGKLVGSGAASTPNQGYSVSLSSDGNTLAYGGPADNATIPGQSGAAWVWKRNGGVWSQYGRKLTVASPNGGFGWSVALSGDARTLVGGAPFDRVVNSNTYVGAFYAFTNIVPHDFNGDTKSDIALRYKSGESGVWLMNGATVIASGGFAALPLSYQLVGQRDFNGDGKTDWLWRGSDGTLLMWFLNGTQSMSVNLGQVPANWNVVGTGDFNGDGYGDILWQDTSGNIAIWLMNGATTISSSVLGQLQEWTFAGVTDLDGDSKSDIVLQHNNGTVAVWIMDGLRIANGATLFPVPWRVVGTGDFDGDGKGDILFRNPQGDIAMWLMNGTSVANSRVVSNVTTLLSIVETGDFDGDGKSDIVYRAASGVASVWYMNGPTIKGSAALPNAGPDWTFVGANAD